MLMHLIFLNNLFLIENITSKIGIYIVYKKIEQMNAHTTASFTDGILIIVPLN